MKISFEQIYEFIKLLEQIANTPADSEYAYLKPFAETLLKTARKKAIEYESVYHQ